MIYLMRKLFLTHATREADLKTPNTDYILLLYIHVEGDFFLYIQGYFASATAPQWGHLRMDSFFIQF